MVEREILWIGRYGFQFWRHSAYSKITKVFGRSPFLFMAAGLSACGGGGGGGGTGSTSSSVRSDLSAQQSYVPIPHFSESAYRNYVYEDDRANLLSGEGESNAIIGRGGDDVLYAGGSTSRSWGGSGDDVSIYLGSGTRGALPSLSQFGVSSANVITLGLATDYANGIGNGRQAIFFDGGTGADSAIILGNLDLSQSTLSSVGTRGVLYVYVFDSLTVTAGQLKNFGDVRFIGTSSSARVIVRNDGEVIDLAEVSFTALDGELLHVDIIAELDDFPSIDSPLVLVGRDHYLEYFDEDLTLFSIRYKVGTNSLTSVDNRLVLDVSKMTPDGLVGLSNFVRIHDSYFIRRPDNVNELLLEGDDRIFFGPKKETLRITYEGEDVVMFLRDDMEVERVVQTVEATSRVLATSARIAGDIGDNDIDASGYTAESVIIYGGGGDDTITGSVGDDYLYGRDGADRFVSSGGDDNLFGGLGFDKASYDTDVTITGRGGILFVDDGDSTDTLRSVEIVELDGDRDTATIEGGSHFTIDISGGGHVIDVDTTGTYTLTGFDDDDFVDLSSLDFTIEDVVITDTMIRAKDLLIIGTNFVENINVFVTDTGFPNDREIVVDSFTFWNYLKTGSYTIIDEVADDRLFMVSLGDKTDTFTATMSDGLVLEEIKFGEFSTVNIGGEAQEYGRISVTDGGGTLEATSGGAVNLNSGSYAGLDSFTGFVNFDGIGAMEALTITGTSGANILTGGAGADTIDGGDGTDTTIYGTGIYAISESGGTITVRTGSISDSLTNIEIIKFEGSGTDSITISSDINAEIDISAGGSDTITIETTGTYAIEGFGDDDLLDLSGLEAASFTIMDSLITSNGGLHITGSNFVDNVKLPASVSKARADGNTYTLEGEGRLTYSDSGSYTVMDEPIADKMLSVSFGGMTDIFTILRSGDVFDKLIFGVG